MSQLIDAAAFRGMVLHGAAAITLQKQPINELNVFPVPDGDTGTNMSMTINAAAQELRKKSFSTVGAAAGATASALLRGARGNSGVILSLLFRGFAKAVKEKDVIDGRDLAVALDYGVAAAYKAVMKPAEGTILTVSRLTAQAAAGAAREDADPRYVLEKAMAEGQAALENTVNQNPVLKKAGVVDAGGKGYLIILQGMLDSLNGLPLPQMAETEESDKADFAALNVEDITFAFDTVFIVRKIPGRSIEPFRAYLGTIGDSLVMLSVLLAKVKAVLKRYGNQETVKYDDGYLCVDFNARQVFIDGEPVKLTSLEFKLLAYLVQNTGRMIPKQEIFEKVWEDKFTGDSTLNVHIRKIREAIERAPSNPEYVLTVWGDGYKFTGGKQ